ncbi:MAG: TIGR04283 family arsenosugar biosynthesis glycosyltransferase [Hyphomicrobiales bacterium]
MLSIIIPTLNSAKELPATFASLMPALLEGAINEVIIVDGGSTDDTAEMADEAGAKILTPETKGRGPQLNAGAIAAKNQWMLFLHSDTELEENWHIEATKFIKAENQKLSEETASPHSATKNDVTLNAAAFKFSLKDKGLAPTILAKLVALRCALFSLPYGDQGLLISKQTYEACGGYPNFPIMEDTDIIRRLPAPVKILQSRAFTSAEKYKKEGYLKRSTRNLYCLAAYYRGLPPEKIYQIYTKSSTS